MFPLLKWNIRLTRSVRAIAESWPNSLDDTCAREEWGWKPQYNLDEMTKDMLEKLKLRFSK